jgi:hypothetical protein
MSDTGENSGFIIPPPTSYLEGTSVRLRATLTDYAGDVLPANLISLLVLRPNASESNLVALEISGDTAFAVVTLDAPGKWVYRFEVVSGGGAAEERIISVRRRSVPAFIPPAP